MAADALKDLVLFARVEQQSGDIEPWAAILWHLRVTGHLDAEQSLWAVKLYNAYDDIGSAFRVMGRWRYPWAWAQAGEDRRVVGGPEFPCSRERRGLRGGRVVQHLDSYVAELGMATQQQWLREPIATGADDAAVFDAAMRHLRRVWHVGRQTAFEWAEFAAKVEGLPIVPPDAYLWESTGPRRALERLYGPVDSPAQLDEHAERCRDLLTEAGVGLSWWDFETVICDFNVMRDGRYYPGQHLAMLRAEIDEVPDPVRLVLRDAFKEIAPHLWQWIAPRVDKDMARAYRDTGRIVTPLGPAEEVVEW